MSPSGLSARQLAILGGLSDPLAVLSKAREIEATIANENVPLSAELIELVADDMRLPLRIELQRPLFDTRQAGRGEERRAPVVSVMGHVDHGKTTLLDALRGGTVAANEAGGITQRLGAFNVALDDGKNAQNALFLDTPGHAAFATMRQMGAMATDIVVLVVAADDGVMPQTVEAARLAAAAGVPVIVALTKIDSPGANVDRVLAQLLETAGINTVALGGEVCAVEICAPKGTGLTQLIDAVLQEAAALPLYATPDAPARMVCIETHTQRALGAVAVVVVRDGSVRVGDIALFQCFNATALPLHARVRSLVDMSGNKVEVAGAGEAVAVVGMKAHVVPGALGMVVANESAAKEMGVEIVAENCRALATVQLAMEQGVDREIEIDRLQSQQDVGVDDEAVEVVRDDAVKGTLNVVIKADVQGSADAVAECVSKLGADKYGVRVLAARGGDVSEADVALASATTKVKRGTDDALIIAFNVRAADGVKRKARQSGVQLTAHRVIYRLEDEIRERIAEAMKRWETSESSDGLANVVRVFAQGTVAGCTVSDGSIEVGSEAKVWRFDGAQRVVVHQGTITSLKRFAKDVRNAAKGSECGVSVDKWGDFEAGDLVESFTVSRGKHA